jgi:hypothetical protein
MRHKRASWYRHQKKKNEEEEEENNNNNRTSQIKKSHYVYMRGLFVFR